MRLNLFKSLGAWEVRFFTEWALISAFNRFQPNTFIEVGKEGLEVKVKALSMYSCVIRYFPHLLRSTEVIEGLQHIEVVSLDVIMQRFSRVF